MVVRRTVTLEIEKAYSAVKASLIQKGCKIISEQSPNRISLKHGSLWGASPKTAKKILEVNLEPVVSGTQLTCYSRLSSDWKNLALIGCAFAAVLIGLCLWMASDLTILMATHKHGFWSWIVTSNGNIDFQVLQAFVNLTKTLAVFLAIIILLEIALFFYIRAKVDRLAEETLNSLSI